MPRRDRIAATARQAEALQLRARGLPYEQVGEALGITKQAAFKLVTRALRATLREAGEQVRQLELCRLDDLLVEATAVLGRPHFHVQGGEVVMHDGVPLPDDGPTLAAIATVLRVQQRRAALLGLDAPTKVDAKVSLQGIWERLTEEEQVQFLSSVPPEVSLKAVHREIAELEAEKRRRDEQDTADARSSRSAARTRAGMGRAELPAPS